MVVSVLWLFPSRIQQDIFAEEDVEMKTADLIFMQAKQLVQVNGSICWQRLHFIWIFIGYPSREQGSCRAQSG
jgi:hypothetical protein